MQNSFRGLESKICVCTGRWSWVWARRSDICAVRLRTAHKFQGRRNTRKEKKTKDKKNSLFRTHTAAMQFWEKEPPFSQRRANWQRSPSPAHGIWPETPKVHISVWVNGTFWAAWGKPSIVLFLGEHFCCALVSNRMTRGRWTVTIGLLAFHSGSWPWYTSKEHFPDSPWKILVF